MINSNHPGVEVRKKSKRFRILIFTLSILISFSLSYFQFDSWGELHFLTPNLSLGNFENVDQDDLVMDPPAKSKGILSSSFVNSTHLGIHGFKDSARIPFQAFSLKQEFFILRC